MTVCRPYEARAGLDFRLLRAAVFTTACVALSAAGHGLVSGAAVPLWTLAAGFVAVLGIAVPLAGRQRSLAGIAAMLAAGQIALHTLFDLGQHARPRSGGTMMMPGGSRAMPGGSMPMHESGGMVMHGGAMPMPGGTMPMQAGAMPVPGGDARLSALPDLPVHDLPAVHGLLMLPSLPMLLGHVLAAVVAGWLLRRGDLAVFRLLALSAQDVAEAALARALRAALALMRALRTGLPGSRPPGPHRPRAPHAVPPPPLRTAALQHMVIRRGPPFGRACDLAA